jgi:glycosyltransferase involved in cell wall biosynthesis
MREALIELGASPEQLHKNPCGVDVDLFQPCDPASNPPRFVAVGRFVEKKAPHLTLTAFREVVREEPEAQLVMIGEGELLAACKQLARALKLEEVVTFTGAVPHEKVVEYMQGARAFVQHSVHPPSGDSEGTSISVLEGAASGLPVVATRHGGIKDSVIDGETGFLIDEYDVSAMAERMRALCADGENASVMGMKGRARMEEMYRMEKSIEGLYDVLVSAHESNGR